MEVFTLPMIGTRFKKLERKSLKGLFSNLLIPTAYLFGLMWSTPTLAHPTQTSPKVFIFP
jgi:hypothetical protein